MSDKKRSKDHTHQKIRRSREEDDNLSLEQQRTDNNNKEERRREQIDHIVQKTGKKVSAEYVAEIEKEVSNAFELLKQVRKQGVRNTLKTEGEVSDAELKESGITLYRQRI